MGVFNLTAKYDEIDDNIPMIKDFIRASKKPSLNWISIVKCESLLVSLLDWNMMLLTPLHVLYLLIG